MTASTPTPGLLSEVPVPPRASEYAKALRADVSEGRFERAFRELREAPASAWERAEEFPLLVEVRDAVANEYTRQAAEPFEELVPMAVHAIGIAPFHCTSIIEDDEGQLHLVRERVPVPDEMGERVHTMCGLGLWNEYATPLALPMRGAWQEPGKYGLSVCGGCAPHAGAFSEAQEPPEAASIPRDLARDFVTAACSNTQHDLITRMPELCWQDPVAVLQEADAKFKEELSTILATQALGHGDELLARVIRRYYDRAKNDLAASGYTAPLSELVTLDEWKVAVGNALEDLLEEDAGAVATSYLYSEIRSVLGEKIRKMR
jgi:hypothetical protein